MGKKIYEKDFDYPVEAGRYRLVASYMCPFCHRAEITRELLGLQDVISIARAASTKHGPYWGFHNQPNGEDEVLHVKGIEEIYQKQDPNYDGKYSAPALVDTTNGHVVNQESMDIIHDFATRFAPLSKGDIPDVYPEGERELIDEKAQWAHDNILMPMELAQQNDGNQEKYEEYYDRLFAGFDTLENHFADHDYFVNDHLTLADVVLFTPLVRFDVQFYIAGFLNKKHLYEYPNLWRYARRLYRIPAFKNTTKFDEMKLGTFTESIAESEYVHPVIPKGPDVSIWNDPIEE